MKDQQRCENQASTSSRHTTDSADRANNCANVKSKTAGFDPADAEGVSPNPATVPGSAGQVRNPPASARQATVTAHRAHPRVELAFAWDEDVVAEVKALPGSRWDGDRRLWIVDDFGGDPLVVLERLGFDAVGADGSPVERIDVRPIARPRPDDPSLWELYQRWGAYGSRLAALIGPSDVRDSTRGCWLVEPERLAGQSWIELAGTLPQTRPAPVAQGLVPFEYDLTLDGLRGIPVGALRGVNSAAEQRLSSVGIDTVHALLHQIPRRYVDLTQPHTISEALRASGSVAVVGVVVKVQPADGPTGMVRVTVRDEDGDRLSCRWFNAPYIARRVKVGQQVVVHGRVEQFRTDSGFVGQGMSNPLIEPVEADSAGRIIGFYPSSAKNDVSTWMIHRAATEAAARLGNVFDPVPRRFTAARNLPSRTEAYLSVHDPKDLAQAKSGRDRLAYDELLRLQIVLAMQKAAARAGQGIAHDTDHSLARRYLASLPFPPTAAQVRCLREIANDMASEAPASRLVQGDVGGGKTLLAVIAMLDAADSGRQAALVAPTEILAFQHWSGISTDLDGLNLDDGSPVRIELLTNKVTGKRRKQVLAGLADGSVHLVVGTHALFADKVEFADLSLVVLDEQHRFGVEQRRAMLSKRTDAKIPDVLQMTATPIPRTAMMTVFGDLDVSTIDELPPGRTPTSTQWMQIAHPTDVNSPVWIDVREQVAAGRQAFVVVPLIAESLTREAAACHDTAERLGIGALEGLRIGTVTGKDTPDVRASTMAAFGRGEIDVLVATTVIEVGVNVPNATVMVVLGADSFGLAQLHQLRGRVGRGAWPGHCWLVATPRTEVGEERMRAMVGCGDGFVLAETDLRLRGAGHMTAAIQSGTGADLLVANVMADVELMVWAKQDAATIVERDPQLATLPALRHEIDRFLSSDAKAWLAAA